MPSRRAFLASLPALTLLPTVDPVKPRVVVPVQPTSDTYQVRVPVRWVEFTGPSGTLLCPVFD